ncbi:MAG TPA: cation-transporting P-type ATPase [Polyangiaceae bacterium]|nr:cation-transporting P-type ATPase [Polyangiaceae bacterium]
MTTGEQAPLDAPLLGLSSIVAAERLRSNGKNELPPPKRVPAWRQIVAQLTHFFAILLWVAGLLAIIGGMPELGVAIFVVIVMNGLFAFLEEHRAERASHHLQRLLPRRAAVRRDGCWTEIDASELVVGDRVRLDAGDLISADLRLVSGRGVSVDQSTLTGESVPVPIVEEELAFAGTFVMQGEAEACVVATGTKTRLARIAQLTQGQRRPRTRLARELDRLVRTVGLIALAIGVLFFFVGWLSGLSLRDGFLFAVGVAVALVPEGLLPTVTLSLAVGASAMARRGALIRRLEALETLGGTTYICTDKTGTLTSNEMNAVDVWTPAGTASVDGSGYAPVARVAWKPEVVAPTRHLALAAVRCSTGRALEREGQFVARGDPMEAALHALSLRVGVELAADERESPELTRFSFDPHCRLMTVVNERWVFTKGAPDAVMARCLVPSPDALQAAADMSARGLRVIAVAQRRVSGADVPQSRDDAERDLELLGLVGLIDPPRTEVKDALARCERAGVRVAMITGDHAGTACAIARQVGLATSLVVTGDELPDDEALLGALLDRDGVIACRVSPEQKQRIAKALQTRGHVVAMTGDGVNDGPALHQADIGIAMGRSGTDVARAAADLVLLDDRFETIVHAIEHGRATFANIRRFLTYHLTDNVAELTPFVLWALSGGRLPLALSVLQILCLDLLTDQMPALALGTEPPAAHLLEQPPDRGHLVDRRLLTRAFLVLGPVESVLEMAAFFGVLSGFGWHPGDPISGSALAAASGAAFLAIVAGQGATALACRSSTKYVFRMHLRDNPRIVAAVLGTWLVTALLLSVPWFARHLGHAVPPALGVCIALLAFPAVLATDTLMKYAQRIATRGSSSEQRSAP